MAKKSTRFLLLIAENVSVLTRPWYKNRGTIVPPILSVIPISSEF